MPLRERARKRTPKNALGRGKGRSISIYACMLYELAWFAWLDKRKMGTLKLHLQQQKEKRRTRA